MFADRKNSYALCRRFPHCFFHAYHLIRECGAARDVAIQGHSSSCRETLGFISRFRRRSYVGGIWQLRCGRCGRRRVCLQILIQFRRRWREWNLGHFHRSVVRVVRVVRYRASSWMIDEVFCFIFFGFDLKNFMHLFAGWRHESQKFHCPRFNDVRSSFDEN